ncbi:MAG: hypothetical protein MJY63_01925 [Paludibacteraceae bacterium]|nr:hypothetical protein [Paludibacteraceae bacterium]
MMKNIVLTLSFLLFGVNVWGQDSILFNHIFEKAPQLPLPFYKKGNTSLKKENQIDTTIMKKCFDIKDFKYDITSFDYETESLEFVDYSIMKVWVDNSWTFKKFKCFVLSSWKDALDGLYDEKFLYFSVLSEKGTLIDKLIFDEHDEENGSYTSFIIYNENTLFVFCYETNWGNYERAINSSGEYTGIKKKDKNAKNTIVHITKYIISDEGKFFVSDKFDVPVQDLYLEYSRTTIPDDPFWEYIK